MMRSRPEPAAYDHRFAYADAFRALAIFGVIFTHIFPELHIGDHKIYLALFGGLCVAFFFFLSGYLLSRQFLDAIIRGGALPSTRVFLKKRLLRIYPAYAVVVFLSLLAIFPTHVNAFVFLVVHLALMQGFLVSQDQALNGPLWTMAVDAEFYIALPILSLFAYRSLKGREKRSLFLSVGLLAIVMGSIAYRIAILTILPPFHGTFDLISLYDVYERNLIGVSSGFAIGAFVALLEIIDLRVNRSIATASAVLGTLLCICSAHPIVSRLNQYVIDLYWDLEQAGSAAFLFFGLSRGGAPFLNSVVRSNFIKLAAELSYSAYLVHWLCLQFTLTYVIPRIHHLHQVVLFLSTTILTLVCAVPINRFIERPFLRMKNKFASGFVAGQ
jgi:peptidoglycan/LPS O-acetylase OafA/YrhL